MAKLTLALLSSFRLAGQPTSQQPWCMLAGHGWPSEKHVEFLCSCQNFYHFFLYFHGMLMDLQMKGKSEFLRKSDSGNTMCSPAKKELATVSALDSTKTGVNFCVDSQTCDNV